ncbi:TlpA disulfide reductase family protein [Dactylosporangium sp. NPDC000244]|uniref:TlpA family protein disulfide reductase n=1 Tax=Dactylosporangium sp. NPDC000244 TaxID=3154365 RepID=UPI00331C32E6
MTTVLLVAVLLLAVLTVFNLVLVLGVIRRLRAFEGRPDAGPPMLTAPAGTRVGDFTSSTVDGSEVSLGSRALVGFFSTTCPACHERLGDFREAAARHSGAAFAVVVRDGGGVEPMLAGLGDTPVVVEDPDGPVASAFGVQGFPAFVLVRAGVIESTGVQVPVPA